MKRFYKHLFYIGAIWEIGRFLFLFLAVSLLVNPTGNPLVNLHLLWLSAGGACTAALFFLMGYAPEKFSSLPKITAVFKFIGILPALIAIIAGFLIPRSMPADQRIALGLAVPILVLAVDVIFLVFLVRYAPDDAGEERGPDLPDFQETRIEEK
jgi:hypothetical protein